MIKNEVPKNLKDNSSPDAIWEAVQITTGETLLYRGGFKEEADIKDVFVLAVKMLPSKQLKYEYSRFDFNPATPLPTSTVRLNRAAIVLAWHIDPSSAVITNLKNTILAMDAQQAGIILPNRVGG